MFQRGCFMTILYSDNRIIICIKPVGVLSTDEPGGLPSLLRTELGDETACVRTVHRLDQVVGGVMLLARSKKAAQLLSAQVREGTFHKEYLAVVHGAPPASGTFRDLLLRDKTARKTVTVTVPGRDVREAVLEFETLDRWNGLTLVQIKLKTGRTHQIRTQFASRGFPLVGDVKYGAPDRLGMMGIGLWSHRLGFFHPQTEKPMAFSAPPPKEWPWNTFPCFGGVNTGLTAYPALSCFL